MKSTTKDRKTAKVSTLFPPSRPDFRASGRIVTAEDRNWLHVQTRSLPHRISVASILSPEPDKGCLKVPAVEEIIMSPEFAAAADKPTFVMQVTKMPLNASQNNVLFLINFNFQMSL